MKFIVTKYLKIYIFMIFKRNFLAHPLIPAIQMPLGYDIT